MSAIEQGPDHHRSGSDYYESPKAHQRTASSDFYEDVDPRFLDENVPHQPTTQVANEPPLPTAGLPSSTAMPPVLMPGGIIGRASPPPPLQTRLPPPIDPMEPTSSYEDLADGARSPIGSEASHFTSISQRGVNPRWQPSMQGYPPPAPSAPSGPSGPRGKANEEILLEGNPDFFVPGVGAPGRGGMRGGRGGMRGRGGRGMPAPGMLGGMRGMDGPMPSIGGAGGRYPPPL